MYNTNDITTAEQPEIVTSSAFERAKIQQSQKKNELKGSFYTPHRNMNCVEDLKH